MCRKGPGSSLSSGGLLQHFTLSITSRPASSTPSPLAPSTFPEVINYEFSYVLNSTNSCTARRLIFFNEEKSSSASVSSLPPLPPLNLLHPPRIVIVQPLIRIADVCRLELLEVVGDGFGTGHRCYAGVVGRAPPAVRIT